MTKKKEETINVTVKLLKKDIKALEVIKYDFKSKLVLNYDVEKRLGKIPIDVNESTTHHILLKDLSSDGLYKGSNSVVITAIDKNKAEMVIYPVKKSSGCLSVPDSAMGLLR